ncbi:leucyl aminopeptidase family protein [Gallaecimonas pentaromativorans]|uniref:Leucyl aminopeptidase n=1 Tax=Gallaecimonas pentaromativorans TaxID=584787 RepID=A0A3N1PEK5_9GAMM|nr:leucyl aminopeptidase family protein [Gallaecimonas pentaromativorans]ROQ30404.1 leucyl aminopeptidase [Gallaecimonas pentaromativorans]
MAFAKPQREASFEAALESGQYDALILIHSPGAALAEPLASVLAEHARIDARVASDSLLIPAAKLPGQRLISTATGPLLRDYDDVRRFYDAGKKAAALALSAGITKPLLQVAGVPDDERYAQAELLSLLGFWQGLWQPLEAREALGEAEVEPVSLVGVLSASLDVDAAAAIEAGRRAGRDLCGTEPERMAPLKFAEYCEKLFAGSPVKVSVLRDTDTLKRDYPLMMAVARASLAVERHVPCVIRLEYQGEGEIEKTLLFAGKGVTYDTGGADLKVGGHMAGMSRDKGGAAAVAGFMKTLAELKPQGIKAIAEIGAVRNSIGADSFVADEIITSHGGVRVRIGNTDAEGRLVLADLLSHLREAAVDAVEPEIFSIATLTGHAARALGPYTAVVENGPARELNIGRTLATLGDLYGDPADVSRVRREDYAFIAPRTRADDVLSCNNAGSSVTARGHQFPMAFLDIASGLAKHGLDSAQPIPYTHLDIAGSGIEGGDWQHGAPSAAPVITLAASYLL